MAEEIIIKIKGDGASPKNKIKTEPQRNEDGSFNLQSLIHPIREAEKSFKKESALGFFTYSKVKNDVALAANSFFQRYATLSEDYKAGQRYENIKSVISSVSSIGESILMGAEVGKYAGPVGMIVGSVVGLAGSVGAQVINRVSSVSSYYQQLNETDYRTEFGRVRAGLIDGGRGTEN